MTLDRKRGGKPSLAKGRLKPLAALVFWLIVWTVASKAVGQELLLPSPAAVLRALVSLGGTVGFWLACAASLARILLGFVSGVALGSALAVLTTFSRLADTLVSPPVRVIRATPVASFIILVLLWFSRTLVPAVISMLMVIPVVWDSLSNALTDVDRDLLEMAKSYKLGKIKTARYVYIPSVKPAFISACLTAQGLAWKSGVAAEVLCLPKPSIGAQLYASKIYLETPSLFALTAVVVVFSFILERIFRYLAGRFQIK